MNLRRGFWRLAALVWAFGAGLLFAWHADVLQDPFADVCEPDVDPPYAECLTDEARRLAEEGGLLDQLMSRVSGSWASIDPERTVSRLSTERYRTSLEQLAWRQLYWFVAIWGVHYLFVWVGRGFST